MMAELKEDYIPVKVGAYKVLVKASQVTRLYENIKAPRQFDRVKLNIGGTTFLTNRSTLQTFTGTRLSSLKENYENYDIELDEYYFDRNPVIFHYILDLYRTGHLHLPADVCGIHIKKELEFWKIPLNHLGECCWRGYYRAEDDMEIYTSLKKELNNTRFQKTTGSLCKSRYDSVKQSIWNFLENPCSSKAAFIWFWIFMLTVFLSITVYFCDTYQISQKDDTPVTSDMESDPPFSDPPTNNSASKTCLHKKAYKQQRERKDLFRIVNSFCDSLFTLEFLLRAFSCPSKREFLKCFLNIADLVHVLGFLLKSCVMIASKMKIWKCKPWCCINNVHITFVVISKLLMSLRNIKFFRIARINKEMKILLMSIERSKKELLLLVLLLMIMSVIFAGFMYHIAVKDENHFDEFHDALYWAIITMTTVGYGDMLPYDEKSRLIASLCAISGLIMLTLPIAVIANNFGELYSRYKDFQRFNRYRHSDAVEKVRSVSK